MKTKYDTASNGEIEIRVDLTQSSATVYYRLIDDPRDWDAAPEDFHWESTPFQRAGMRSAEDALQYVADWLGDDED